MEIDAIRAAAAPLSAVLPRAAWLPHKLVRLPDGRLDKPPCGGATSNNPASWFTLDAALNLLASPDSVAAGVAFAITNGVIGLDYDKCRNRVTGELTPQVQIELEKFNSYAYVTPSGEGIRIVGTNSATHPIPGGKKVRYLPDDSKVEIFIGPTNHYNTFTHDIIEGYDKIRDISDDVLDYLESLQGSQYDNNSTTPPVSNPDAERCADAIRAALKSIPNEHRDWEWWNKVGMTVWRSSQDKNEGLEAWREWSAKHPLHDDTLLDKRWQHFFTSPPTKLGFGSLYHWARQANPLFVPPFDRAIQERAQDANKAPPSPLPLIYFSDIQPNLDAADFVEGLLIEGSMAVVYGESNCGKTFFMTDLGIHIAMGRPWRGREIELGAVIYCALEGSHGISNRVAAFREHHKLGPLELPFAIIPSSINMLDPGADTDRLIQTIQAVAADMGVPVRLTVIDTLSRALAGGNENAPDDMGALVTNTDKVRQATRAAVAYVHHSGKDAAKGARGHSLLRAATDTEIEVAREDSKSPSVARVTKQRELEIEGEFGFRLEVVELGKNRRGKAVTSCVVIDDEDVAAQAGQNGTKPKRLPPNATLGMRALTIALGRSGAKLPPHDDYPRETWAVSVSVWRDEFYQLKSGSPDTNKHAFSTAETVLLSHNVITERNGLVWLCKRDNATGQTG